MSLLAAIDQGTTGTRCFLFDLAGRVVASAYREHAQTFAHPGWVEHDALEIRDNVDRVVAETVAAGPREPVLALGVTNQRETVVLWDALSGIPIAPAIVWQDTRTDTKCRALIAGGFEPEVRSRTGLPIRTYFSATKIHWLLANVPEAKSLAASGRLRIGTMDSWVIWNLTGGPRGGAHVTDPTNASRTLLCALSTLAWDPELRDGLGLIATASETEPLARSVPDAGGVYFVPAFSGLFAPHWDMSAPGTIVGLTRFATRAHLVRATLEAIAFQSREVLEAMSSDSGLPPESLKVDGGATENNFLMQLQADVLGIPVVRPAVRETTALGAAQAAGLACGAYTSLTELSSLWREDRTFEPEWTADRREESYRGWARAVHRSRGWLET